MSLSLYQVSIESFIKNLKIVLDLIAKAEEFSADGEVDLAQVKLAEDMGNFCFQIQRLSDTSKGVAVRLCGAEPVALADTEKTLSDCKARIASTIAILEAVSPDSTDGKENTEIIVKAGPNEFKFTGLSYVTGFAVPNFYFHFVMVYALLRKEGVQVGKGDFLGRTL